MRKDWDPTRLSIEEMKITVSLNLHTSLRKKKIFLLRTDNLFNAALLCWVTPDFELYAAFDPLADKVRFLKTF